MTTIETLLAALVLGLATIPHCLVMCGPVAVMACSHRRATFAYLGGRLVGYAAAGSVMGVIGAHAFRMLGADVVGRAALVALAGVCAWQAYRAWRPAREKLVRLGKRERSTTMDLLASLAPKSGLGLGLATAVFPCGALPAAWAVAASSGHPVTGAGAMLTFAIASTPGLVVAVTGRSLFQRIAHRIPDRAKAAAWLIVASALIARAWVLDPPCHG
jgi:sulfite exporter TauE/SafE